MVEYFRRASTVFSIVVILVSPCYFGVSQFAHEVSSTTPSLVVNSGSDQASCPAWDEDRSIVGNFRACHDWRGSRKDQLSNYNPSSTVPGNSVA